MTLFKVVIGICAHNEENNIRRLLQNLIFEQNLPKTCKILIICSGCTDRTPDIAKESGERDTRIETVIERFRKGKANALNRIFKIARESAEMLVLVNADALPKRGSINTLVSKLMASNAGAVFAQPVPFKEGRGNCYKIVRVIWRLHHIISFLQRPKLSGELCAVRASCLQDIPENVATDEPYIELAIHKQGYNILYVPEALVYIRCPTNLIDLLKQRKRIWVGHMQVQKATNFKVSTSSFRNVLRAMSALKPDEVLYAMLGGFLETIAYAQARIALSRGMIPYIWEPIRSTKIQL
jgi:cellulose synthase/poly-beta-1,6-N-acetylglucosamine synthase-like glycosyltransferase